ncbi:type VI secretion protein [Raoultella ornithinolytica]|nr:type VI secretion protein [Raoultella ornithinolytica]
MGKRDYGLAPALPATGRICCLVCRRYRADESQPPLGVIEAAFEQNMLKLGRLQASRLHIRFQDGTLVDSDNADGLPSVLSLEGESHETIVVLALPLWRANGGNCLKPDEAAERPVRYRQRWHDVRNQFGDDNRQIAVLQPELSLRFAHQNNSDYLTCPVARLQQDSQGVWTLDDSFLPPLLSVRSSRWLMKQLDQLMTQLRGASDTSDGHAS